MKTSNYIVVTSKSWNIEIFEKKIRHFPGNWFLISNQEELNQEYISRICPQMIFFPHWSYKVPDEIVEKFECVCFHMTDLPFGRGGSPLQNLIASGIRHTMISALRMTDKIDAGPIYMKKPMSLEGLAEEIYIRASGIIADMIEELAKDRPIPVEQTGEPVVFKRRKPCESLINKDSDSLQNVFDHIRMLDAEGYPRAYVEFGNLRLEFSRPALKADGIIADARITIIEKDKND